MSAIPEGWREVRRLNPFNTLVGPLYERRAGERHLRARREGRVTRDVVLAPGLWMPGAAMALLAARLLRAGYTPTVFAYRGRSPLEANVARFARFVRESLGARPAHYVGHSL